jgi:hypothetical protein
MSEMSTESKRPWFRRPSTLIWFVIAIVSIGGYAPVFIASLRQLKSTAWIASLLLLGVTIAAISENELMLLVVWLLALVASLVLRKKREGKKNIAPSATISSNQLVKDDGLDEEQLVKDDGLDEEQSAENDFYDESTVLEMKEIIEIDNEIDEYLEVLDVLDHTEKTDEHGASNEQLAPIKMGLVNWIKFTFSTKKQINLVAKSLEAELNYQRNLSEAKQRFEQMTQDINVAALDSAAERNIFEVSGCALIEVRKGARITHRESSYSSSGGGAGVRIGPVGVGGGSSSGSSSSTTVSYPAPDELTVIDSGGKFIISNLKISYAGSMFTKTTDFKKIVDYKYKGYQLLIAPKTGTKVWITEFSIIEDLWIAVALIQVALEIDEKRLDAKAVTEYGSAGTAVKFAFKRKVAELELAFDDSIKEVASFRDTYAKYQRLFPGRVKNLPF